MSARDARLRPEAGGEGDGLERFGHLGHPVFGLCQVAATGNALQGGDRDARASGAAADAAGGSNSFGRLRVSKARCALGMGAGDERVAPPGRGSSALRVFWRGSGPEKETAGGFLGKRLSLWRSIRCSLIPRAGAAPRLVSLVPQATQNAFVAPAQGKCCANRSRSSQGVVARSPSSNPVPARRREPPSMARADRDAPEAGKGHRARLAADVEFHDHQQQAAAVPHSQRVAGNNATAGQIQRGSLRRYELPVLERPARLPVCVALRIDRVGERRHVAPVDNKDHRLAGVFVLWQESSAFSKVSGQAVRHCALA